MFNVTIIQSDDEVLVALLNSQLHILERIYDMSQALDRLTADVAAERTQSASLITLVNGLAEQIRANVDDSDALNALADDIESQTSDITDAITANTTSGDTGADAASGAGGGDAEAASDSGAEA